MQLRYLKLTAGAVSDVLYHQSMVSVSVGGGQAQVYLGSEFGLGACPAWSVVRSTANCAYGWSAATAGDVNGDGYADIAVGAPWDESGQTNEGLVYVYSGSQTYLSHVVAWS